MYADKIFLRAAEARAGDVLIERLSERDKEFHFQDWFKSRLDEEQEDSGLQFEDGGRNSYPDFRLVRHLEGFEVKGLAYPGREADYDCNSQVPVGLHNGRSIYYVFGRYPKDPDGDSYPVLDLVICHGNLLNADSAYRHKNTSVPAFGSYGDLRIRDRKMYVAPTPFALLEGTAHQATLILPAESEPHGNLVQVGEFQRVEVDRIMSGYSFDFATNELEATFEPNPHSGRQHDFRAWRLGAAPASPEVKLAPKDD